MVPAQAPGAAWRAFADVFDDYAAVSIARLRDAKGARWRARRALGGLRTRGAGPTTALRFDLRKTTRLRVAAHVDEVRDDDVDLGVAVVAVASNEVPFQRRSLAVSGRRRLRARSAVAAAASPRLVSAHDPRARQGVARETPSPQVVATSGAGRAAAARLKTTLEPGAYAVVPTGGWFLEDDRAVGLAVHSERDVPSFPEGATSELVDAARIGATVADGAATPLLGGDASLVVARTRRGVDVALAARPSGIETFRPWRVFGRSCSRPRRRCDPPPDGYRAAPDRRRRIGV